MHVEQIHGRQIENIMNSNHFEFKRSENEAYLQILKPNNYTTDQSEHDITSYKHELKMLEFMNSKLCATECANRTICMRTYLTVLTQKRMIYTLKMCRNYLVVSFLF